MADTTTPQKKDILEIILFLLTEIGNVSLADAKTWAETRQNAQNLVNEATEAQGLDKDS